MMAPLLQPAPVDAPGRISQLLPTVKCSNCNSPVPLTDLGDHVCPTPPSVPTLPKPAVSPAAAKSLLPQRLQDRVASPAPSPPSAPRVAYSPPRSQPPPAPSPNDRLRSNTGPSGSPQFQQRSSPLARPDPNRVGTPSPAGRPREQYSPPQPPINNERHRPPPLAAPPSQPTRNPSAHPIQAAHPVPPSPRTARPSFSSTRDMVPPANFQPPPRQLYTPQPLEAEIDTKSGGEAGMAGVGRRGFAAAARAAMFVRPPPPPDRLYQSQPGRRENTPYLDIDVPRRSNGTPPLSAGSGYSSHSPDVSPYPPSPPERYGSPHQLPTPKAPIMEPPAPPQSPRMPFFEKFKNQLPGATTPNSNRTPTPNHDIRNNNNNTPTPTQPLRTKSRDSDTASSSSAYSRMLPSRSISINTKSSRDDRLDKPPLSPSSGSEYGLAYADSTDYEGEDQKENTKGALSKTKPPPPLALTSSILRSGSTASTNHVRFPSISDRSEVPVLVPGSNGLHKRNGSASSLSSVSSAGERTGKSNSALIAQALGLSQTPPSAYARLGGPGVSMGGRNGRSGSTSSGSSGSRSAYSRGTHGGPAIGKPGVMEREMETLLEDVAAADTHKVGLSKSKSTGRQRSFGMDSDSDTSGKSGVMKGPANSGPKAHRSNTVPGPYSPESKTPKLPVRARTSTERNTDAGREKKERTRKPRVCVKCEKKIEDGRWIQTDGPGVLCEKCWKNMYLPKCRRCNLPIEKQAVSSSDGQLKGKYHRECFNCHTCHKPFPDKTFYVFDGKPFCAYHYHEANDSLCAAARCGQPIEGPCAVSHTGDKYHPEHMTCEHPGSPPCAERLSEYWEVDGRMLCERHAHASRVGSEDGEEAEEEWVQSSRAMKRVTRFIDLAGVGGSDLR